MINVIGAFLIIVLGIFIGLLYKGIDRRLAARLQARIGPPIIQPFYDIRKLMMKETVKPENAVSWMYELAPVLSLAASLLILLYIPFPGIGSVLGSSGDLIVVLYLLMLPSLFMVFGGFASGNPYAAVGAQREMVMMMSYELPLATVAIAIAWKIGSFILPNIVSAPVWLVVGPLGIVGFLLLLFVILSVVPAELSKIPFDAPEAETEIAGGLLVDYSGRNLALFYLSDAVKSFAISALVVVLFFPFDLGLTGIASLIWFLLKVLIVMVISITFVRVLAARLQIDNVARYYWKTLSVIAILGLVLIMLDGVIA